MPSKIITTPVRFSYLFANTAKVNKKGDSSYGAMLVWPKSDKALTKMIKDAITAAFKEDKENGNVLKIKGDTLPANLSTTLYDGDVERPDDPVVEGCWYLNASSNRKIEVLDRNRDVIDDSDKIYSGMFGRALLRFKAYNNESKGITCYLNGIQKTKDGDRLDGTNDPSKEFDDDFDEFEDEDDYTPPAKNKKQVEDDYDDL